MRKLNWAVVSSITGLLIFGSAQARAADFSVTKDTATGVITFTDTNGAYPVIELLVAANVLNGISGQPGTTLVGWATENLSFGVDPLGCNPPRSALRSVPRFATS